MTRVGLVLGGGGVLGQAFHAGVLDALHGAGWDARGADVILGTSAGSQIGALLRAGVSGPDLAAATGGGAVSEEGARLLAPVRAEAGIPAPAPAAAAMPRMCSPALLRRLATRPARARVGLVIAALAPEGRRGTDRFVAGLAPLFPGDWPAAKLWITAIRLDTGERVVFGRDADLADVSVGQAVAASCAVPGFFRPAAIGGHRYVDGGCHSPTNLDLLAGEPLDVVVVSSPLSMDGRPRSPARALHSAELAVEAAKVRRAGTAVVVFQPDTRLARLMGRDSMDSRRAAAVVSASRDAAATSCRVAGGTPVSPAPPAG